MNLQELVGKTAADRNNKKLGKIIKIEKIQDQKTKIWKEQILILVHNIFRKDVVILIEAEKLLKAENTFASFDLEKEEFEQEVRETRALMHLYKE
ncbi:MAG: hypothetical protein FK732_03075 [Asgard group archaeon]|nr:hypothetical protein [Asgard group archaeon]